MFRLSSSGQKNKQQSCGVLRHGGTYRASAVALLNRIATRFCDQLLQEYLSERSALQCRGTLSSLTPPSDHVSGSEMHAYLSPHDRRTMSHTVTLADHQCGIPAHDLSTFDASLCTASCTWRSCQAHVIHTKHFRPARLHWLTELGHRGYPTDAVA